VTVQHVVANRHRHLRATGAYARDLHAERARSSIARVHAACNALRERLAVCLGRCTGFSDGGFTWLVIGHYACGGFGTCVEQTIASDPHIIRLCGQTASDGVPSSDQRGDAVPVLAVVRGEMVQHVEDPAHAHVVRPRQGSPRVVDALLHRDVDIAC